MKTIAILSALIIITPFLGVPNSWKTTLIVVLGLVIFFKSFYSYRMNKMEKTDDKDTAFTQNNYLADEEIKKEVGDLRSTIDNNEEDKKIEVDSGQSIVGGGEERKEKTEEIPEMKAEISETETEVEENKPLS